MRSHAISPSPTFANLLRSSTQLSTSVTLTPPSAVHVGYADPPSAVHVPPELSTSVTLYQNCITLSTSGTPTPAVHVGYSNRNNITHRHTKTRT